MGKSNGAAVGSVGTAGLIMNKQIALKLLRQKIVEQLFVDRWREVWFFPAKFGVKGWQGTAPIMFIGLNPSGGGHFPSQADHLFYKCLAKNGFWNAHLTDVHKVRATAQEVPQIQRDSILLRLNRNYLLKEVGILQPRLVVALGKTTHDLLKDWLPDIPKERLLRIPHYSWACRYKHEKRFLIEMNNVRKYYSQCRKGIVCRSPKLEKIR